MTLFSIGYGNRTWSVFLELLQRRACQYLIDVRSSPFSKFNPDFSRDNISSLCSSSGIKYVFMGDTLGGKPIGAADVFDNTGRVDYLRLAETPQFQLGLARLRAAHNKGLSSFVMCSELRPESCHRCKLIGAELAEIGIEMIHVDEAGIEITQREAISRLDGGQDDMFGANPSLTTSRGSYGP